MVQSPSATRLTLLNLVQQIGRSNVATSVVVEDMENVRDLKRRSQGNCSCALLRRCHKNIPAAAPGTPYEVR